MLRTEIKIEAGAKHVLQDYFVKLMFLYFFGKKQVDSLHVLY